MRKRTAQILALILAAALLAGTAGAQVSLRFSPADTTLGPGQTGRLTIQVETPGTEIRAIAVYVTYDTTVVRSLGGSAGGLFTSSGYMLFNNFEYPEPGQWHGFTSILGVGDHVTGPGELYAWDFETLADGVSPILSVAVYVAASDGSYYPEVTLPPTTITVFDPLSSAPDLPRVRPTLRAWPNPFNPRTSLTVDLPTAEWGRLTVHDVRGREVAVLHAGILPAGQTTFSWDGRDDGGRALPGGLYLFRLATDNTATTTKGLLVK